jgi:hypothetical protein
MKTALVVGLAVMAQAAANTLLSKGMKVIAATPSFGSGFSPLLLAEALQNPFIWGGIFLLIVYFACFLAAGHGARIHSGRSYRSLLVG